MYRRSINTYLPYGPQKMFSTEAVEGFIETLCIDWLFLLFFYPKSKLLWVYFFFTIDKFFYAFEMCGVQV